MHMPRTRTYHVTMTQLCSYCEGSGFLIGQTTGQCPHCTNGIETVTTDIINALDHLHVFADLRKLENENALLKERLAKLESSDTLLTLAVRGIGMNSHALTAQVAEGTEIMATLTGALNQLQDRIVALEKFRDRI